MRTELQTAYSSVFHDLPKEDYRAFLTSQSTISAFEDDKWICDLRRRSAAEQVCKLTIYFSSVPTAYREMVKYAVLLELMEGKRVNTVDLYVNSVGLFLQFLGGLLLESVDIEIAQKYRQTLDGSGLSESTRQRRWMCISRFLTAMNGYDGMRLRNPFLINPYNAPKLFDRKYIPEETANELDRVFMKEEIPLHLRCIYWTLRLIPSRVSEVLGMKIDCVKPFDDHYCIMIPTWKQNGGYAEPIVRTIHVRQEGMGEFLLGLLWEQQKRACAYQEYMVPEQQGYLLTYRQQIEQKGITYDKDHFLLATWTTVSWGLTKVCKKYGVCGEDGKPYRVTSHQFRHNGITDRLLAGFTPAEIADMTGHHGTAMMMQSYAHLNLFPETLAEPIRYRKEGEVPKDRILFCGRILSMSPADEARLLRNLRSHRVPGGICSDVSHCKSGMWNCVACENFIPEAEQVDWFRAQAKDWNDKAERFCSEPAMAETFRMNAARFAEIVKKIQNMEAAEHEKEDS